MENLNPLIPQAIGLIFTVAGSIFGWGPEIVESGTQIMIAGALFVVGLIGWLRTAQIIGKKEAAVEIAELKAERYAAQAREMEVRNEALKAQLRAA